MTMLSTHSHRPVNFEAPAVNPATLRLRTVDGRYLHQDVTAAKLVARSTWAWKGTLPQMHRVLQRLPAEIRVQLLPTNLDGLPVSIRRQP